MKSFASFRRPVRLTLASSALALSLALGMGSAHAQQSVAVIEAEGGNLWFVELSGAPEADGNSKAAVRAEKAAFRNAAAAAGVKWKERRSYDVLFNGFAIEAAPAERAKLAMLPGFKSMYPIDVIQAPEPARGGGSAVDLANAVAMTGANIAQASGLTGAGIKVGIIDTGIDIDHPDFGGGGVPGGTPFPSARVAYGYDFVGDNYDAGGSPAQQVPVPDNNPDDCGGHGTHVAGIVGANGAVKGVAPGVTFGAYRVFGCNGSASSDVILAAMERALADGMQVVNQSLGSGRQWPQYPTAAASSRLVQRGVIMVASIGNNGPGGSSPDGLYAAGAPGVGEGVIGVASFNNTASTQLAFTLTPGGETVAYNRSSGSPPSPVSGSLPLVNPTVATGCSLAEMVDVSGKAVHIRRGVCSFYLKAKNAMDAGAAAVVISNNAAGELNATVAPPLAGDPPIVIPVVTVTQANGNLINTKIAAGPTTLNWTGTTVSAPLAGAGLISSFSSFGLAADLSFKPNLGAPGGSIYSTYPIELGSYATLSGTSMSSPHVAGAVALVLQARPRTSPSQMITLLQNSADPKLWNLNPGLGLLDNVHRQGAGMIDIPQAIAATATVTPSEIALGESAGRQQRIKLQINSSSRAGVTYDLTHVPGLASGPGTFVNQLNYFAAPATVEFARSAVQVQGPSVENVDVTITAPAGLPDGGIYGGYLVLTPRNGGQPLRVPYAGYKGDYQQIVALSRSFGLPYLMQQGAGPMPDGTVYTMVGTDYPYLWIQLAHHSESVLLEALDAASGSVVGRISLDEWVTRNAASGQVFAFEWYGDVFKKDPTKPNQWWTVPDGDYKIRVTLRKALADKNDPEHYETWTSPMFTIARP